MDNPAENELKKISEIEFYNKLEDEAPVNDNIDRYLNYCNGCYSSLIIKEYARKLVRNYGVLKAQLNEDSYNKYCRFFLYWLYRAKEVEFPQRYSDRRKHWERCIPCIWKKLEDDANNHKGKCDFKDENISYGFIKVKKALDEICSIKDILKNDNEQNPDTEKCLYINSIKKYYLNDLLSNIGSISSYSSWKEEYFKIDKDCSLVKIYNYLSEIQCPPKEIVQHTEKEQCKVPEQVELQECKMNTCNNLDELCQQHYATYPCDNLVQLYEQNCQTKLCTSVERVTQGDCTPTCDLEKLCPKVCTKQPPYEPHSSEEKPENPAKNPYLQLPVTVFSSVIGTIFFFLFLYKVKDISF